MLDLKKIKELDSQFGDSFYLLMVNKLRDNFHKINTAFKKRYGHFIIGYSYKTNYLPYLCKEMNHLGAHAEVVSRLEYDLALKIGVDPKRIIFNGPLKSYEDISLAIENESHINIDSIYELDYIKQYCDKNPAKQVKIGIRINFDLGNNDIQDGYPNSRFGICLENGDLDVVVHELKQLENARVVGVHSHFSTSTRKVETYGMITRKLCQIAKRHFPTTIEFIDVGGGIYGELPKSFHISAPSFDDYAEVICSIIKEEFNEYQKKPYLVLEPGISMVANTFLFVAKIIDVKDVRGSTFVLVNGSVHNIKPTMHKKNLPMHMVAEESRKTGVYNVVGYTCMEKDYLAHEVEGDIPERNDYLIFENVGAYTIVFNPPFIKERPPIVAINGNEALLVRKKETLREFFNEDVYCF